MVHSEATNNLISGNQWDASNLTQNGGYVDSNGVTHITYTFDATNPDGTGDLTPEQQQLVREWMDSYENVANIEFHEVTDGSRANINYFTTTESSSYSNYPTADGTDTVFNFWGQNDPQAGDSRHWVVGHEIGHALGLPHPEDHQHFNNPGDSPYNNGNTVMDYQPIPGDDEHAIDDSGYGNGSTHATGPQIYDIDALQSIYGANPNYNVNDTIYTYDGSEASAKTIWDAGGNDTLDMSSANQGGRIDLREGPGYMTEVGDTKRWIAYGANIENAIGTNHNDLIHGNELDNTLLGNGGADWIQGHGGTDNIYGGSGLDRYVFDTNFGTDTLHDFNIANEQLILSSNLFDSPADVLANTTYANGNAYINAGANGTIVIENVAPNSLGAKNIQVVDLADLAQENYLLRHDNTINPLHIALGVASAGVLSFGLGALNQIRATKEFHNAVNTNLQAEFQKQIDDKEPINTEKALRNSKVLDLKDQHVKQSKRSWAISGGLAGGGMASVAATLTLAAFASVTAGLGPLIIVAAGVIGLIASGIASYFIAGSAAKHTSENYLIKAANNPANQKENHSEESKKAVEKQTKNCEKIIEKSEKYQKKIELKQDKVKRPDYLEKILTTSPSPSHEAKASSTAASATIQI